MGYSLKKKIKLSTQTPIYLLKGLQSLFPFTKQKNVSDAIIMAALILTLVPVRHFWGLNVVYKQLDFSIYHFIFSHSF